MASILVDMYRLINTKRDKAKENKFGILYKNSMHNWIFQFLIYALLILRQYALMFAVDIQIRAVWYPISNIRLRALKPNSVNMLIGLERIRDDSATNSR